ncbi:DUF4870 domain-containing protein [Alteromonas gilva]|uniref:DUF4870 domain-containing protein n=1 Tax=Alteromonas gilva TaxID=2987522 RepID=A0ABT5L4I5_9ALTE|nr:DUF4870 domain-containing protein [Alteromonas gilva]MDC8831944.1 DUF4870 domain-containing protein [Alteromonas gilva]
MEQQDQYWGMSLRSYCMLIHLSQLTSIVAPGLGFIMPIILWVANKDQHPDIDRHGKVTVNWIISFVIYAIVSVILFLIFIGSLGILVLVVLNFLFAVIAAVKANNGQLWAYPLSIKFLKY